MAASNLLKLYQMGFCLNCEWNHPITRSNITISYNKFLILTKEENILYRPSLVVVLIRERRVALGVQLIPITALLVVPIIIFSLALNWCSLDDLSIGRDC